MDVGNTKMLSEIGLHGGLEKAYLKRKTNRASKITADGNWLQLSVEIDGYDWEKPVKKQVESRGLMRREVAKPKKMHAK